ncbi:MAG: hypothetical protein JSW41_03205 [Candidatus Aenigmatarchaeota archaeon]|nr:MAG: hypothetical protein JSW41_03205 [Candidatus Aenigmarchaeota archaeon]
MQVFKKKEILKDVLEKRRNVIDLIVEMKDLAGLAIDLGFSALLLQDKKLADKITELKEEMEIKQYEIEMECMLAASNVEQALGLTSVMRVASAVADISDAVNEIIDSILRGIPPHPIIKEALKAAAETIDYVNIKKDSKVAGKTIDEATKGLVDVIGLKREDVWSYQPSGEDRIKAKDFLIISGGKRRVSEVIKELRK